LLSSSQPSGQKQFIRTAVVENHRDVLTEASTTLGGTLLGMVVGPVVAGSDLVFNMIPSKDVATERNLPNIPGAANTDIPISVDIPDNASESGASAAGFSMSSRSESLEDFTVLSEADEILDESLAATKLEIDPFAETDEAPKSSTLDLEDDIFPELCLSVSSETVLGLKGSESPSVEAADLVSGDELSPSSSQQQHTDSIPVDVVVKNLDTYFEAVSNQRNELFDIADRVSVEQSAVSVAEIDLNLVKQPRKDDMRQVTQQVSLVSVNSCSEPESMNSEPTEKSVQDVSLEPEANDSVDFKVELITDDNANGNAKTDPGVEALGGPHCKEGFDKQFHAHTFRFEAHVDHGIEVYTEQVEHDASHKDAKTVIGIESCEKQDGSLSMMTTDQSFSEDAQAPLSRAEAISDLGISTGDESLKLRQEISSLQEEKRRIEAAAAAELLRVQREAEEKTESERQERLRIQAAIAAEKDAIAHDAESRIEKERREKLKLREELIFAKQAAAKLAEQEKLEKQRFDAALKSEQESFRLESMKKEAVMLENQRLAEHLREEADKLKREGECRLEAEKDRATKAEQAHAEALRMEEVTEQLLDQAKAAVEREKQANSELVGELERLRIEQSQASEERQRRDVEVRVEQERLDQLIRERDQLKTSAAAESERFLAAAEAKVEAEREQKFKLSAEIDRLKQEESVRIQQQRDRLEAEAQRARDLELQVAAERTAHEELQKGVQASLEKEQKEVLRLAAELESLRQQVASKTATPSHVSNPDEGKELETLAVSKPQLEADTLGVGNNSVVEPKSSSWAVTGESIGSSLLHFVTTPVILTTSIVSILTDTSPQGSESAADHRTETVPHVRMAADTLKASKSATLIDPSTENSLADEIEEASLINELKELEERTKRSRENSNSPRQLTLQSSQNPTAITGDKDPVQIRVPHLEHSIKTVMDTVEATRVEQFHRVEGVLNRLRERELVVADTEKSLQLLNQSLKISPEVAQRDRSSNPGSYSSQHLVARSRSKSPSPTNRSRARHSLSGFEVGSADAKSPASYDRRNGQLSPVGQRSGGRSSPRTREEVVETVALDLSAISVPFERSYTTPNCSPLKPRLVSTSPRPSAKKFSSLPLIGEINSTKRYDSGYCCPRFVMKYIVEQICVSLRWISQRGLPAQ
jgi:hypothetical protein